MLKLPVSTISTFDLLPVRCVAEKLGPCKCRTQDISLCEVLNREAEGCWRGDRTVSTFLYCACQWKWERVTREQTICNSPCHLSILVLSIYQSIIYYLSSICQCACMLICFSSAQLFVTLWNIGSSVHGDSSGKNNGVGCHALLLGIFPTQGLNLSLMSPSLADGFFTTSPILEAQLSITIIIYHLSILSNYP